MPKHKPTPSNLPGSAASCGKMNRKVGFTDHGGKVWCGREGWVSFEEIKRSVAKAFASWQARKGATITPRWQTR